MPMLLPCKWTTWYKCLVCQRCFQQSDGLIVHKKQTECGRLYPTFAERNVLNGSNRYNEPEGFNSLDISPSITNDKPAETNIVIETPSSNLLNLTANLQQSPLSCLLPEKTLSSRQKPVAENKSFACYFCKNIFCDLQNLQVHMKSHTSERHYKCKTCERSFGKLFRLRLHVETVHDSHPLSNGYFCKICHKKFSSQQALNKHMLIHEGPKPKPFSCSICQKPLGSRNGLQYHMSTHEGRMKLFSCSICQKSLSTQQSLNTHMLIHEGLKPFTCKICQKYFRQLSNLKSHMLFHEKHNNSSNFSQSTFCHQVKVESKKFKHKGPNPFSCTICKKDFRFLGNLNMHTRAHELLLDFPPVPVFTNQLADP